jgi:hypothetical protein
MWLSAIKLAVEAGSHIYKNKQKTKMLMADAQMNHAQKMSTGELEYSGKLLEARQFRLERRIYFNFTFNADHYVSMVRLVR